MTTSPRDAAAHLARTSGFQVSNLHIQKMLYLADLRFLQQQGERLLSEDFEAWDYGPVVPSLYHFLKAFGSKPVPNVFWSAPDLSARAEGEVLSAAWAELRALTPGQLVGATHAPGGAWALRYRPGVRGSKIFTADMLDEINRRRRAA